jgi:hypothetical protein
MLKKQLPLLFALVLTSPLAMPVVDNGLLPR